MKNSEIPESASVTVTLKDKDNQPIFVTQTNGVRQIPEQPALLKPSLDTNFLGVGVDRENKVLRGYVVAQAGRFKDWRGEFNEEGLQSIANVINSKRNGVKVRFTHPTLSDDGLGKHLGRSKNAVLTTATTFKGEQVLAVRADLHFDPTAMDTPPGGGKPMGEYVMNLAESDPEALSSSIAVFGGDLEMREQKDTEGLALKDEQGNKLPPLWFVKDLHASDIVDTGDAVDGLLSAELPDDAVRRGCELLDKVFSGQTLEVTGSRAIGFLRKYINLRFGPDAMLPGDELNKQIEELGAEKTHLLSVIEELQERLNKENEKNAVLEAENIRHEVEILFNQELSDVVLSGEYEEYLKSAIEMRKSGDGPNSPFRIFIKSLKARNGKNISTKEIAGDVGHTITVEVVDVDPMEQKQDISGFLMP